LSVNRWILPAQNWPILVAGFLFAACTYIYLTWNCNIRFLQMWLMCLICQSFWWWGGGGS
jgi:hypothetical protein